jgi:hypothetical protein
MRLEDERDADELTPREIPAALRALDAALRAIAAAAVANGSSHGSTRCPVCFVGALDYVIVGSVATVAARCSTPGCLRIGEGWRMGDPCEHKWRPVDLVATWEWTREQCAECHDTRHVIGRSFGGPPYEDDADPGPVPAEVLDLEPPDPFDLPCDGERHRWPAGCASGDTCQCGRYYLHYRDRIVGGIEIEWTPPPTFERPNK